MDGGAQRIVASISHVLIAPLPRLDRDRRSAGNALQTLSVDKARAIVTDLGEQPWRQFGARTWQRSEQAVIRMAGEQSSDAFAVNVQLALDGMQEVRQ